MKKRIIFPALALGILTTAGFWGANQVLASQGELGNGLVQRLAEHFNLNQTEVEDVVNQYRNEQQSQMQAERQTQTEERLNQAVSDGQITQAQKDALTAKLAEFQADRPNMAGSDPEERQADMESHRTAMTAWVEANGIDPNILPNILGRGLNGEGQHRGGFGSGK